MAYIRDDYRPLCFHHNPRKIDPVTGLVVRQACTNFMSTDQQARSCLNCPFRNASSMAESES
jgi:hypothetical protein